MLNRFTRLGVHITSISSGNWRRTLCLSGASPKWTDNKPDAWHEAHQQQRPRNNDIADMMDVESNLFENSGRNSQPVDTQQLLARYSTKTKLRGNNNIGSASKKNVFQSKTNKNDRQEAETVVKEKKPKRAKVKSDVVNSTSLGLTYTKLHLNDPWLNTLLMTVKSRKTRTMKHQLLVEGRRLIIDAIQSGLVLDYILFSDADQLALLKPHLPPHAQLIKVPSGDLRTWSNLSTCPGLMAIFTRPLDMSHIWEKRQSQPLPITVICDQIREPNNVGSIIRNCAAIAVQQVIVTKGCADPWESKALRGGAGAQFKIPIRGPCEWSSIRSMLPADEECFVYLAENNRENALTHIGDATDVDNRLAVYSEVEYQTRRHCVVVIGGETEGISADAYRLLSRNVLGKCVHIPLAADVESLNTAAALAVILFEIKKQILATTSGRNTDKSRTLEV